MSEIDSKARNVHKVRRRKTRGERNKIVDKHHKLDKDTKPVSNDKVTKPLLHDKEKVNFRKKHVSVLKGVVCSNQSDQQVLKKNNSAVLGSTRLTRKLGLFNQVKKSETIVHEPIFISDSVEKETNEELNKILNTSGTYSTHSKVSDSEIDTCVMLPSEDDMNQTASVHYEYMPDIHMNKRKNKRADFITSTKVLENGSSYKRRLHKSADISKTRNNVSTRKQNTPMETDKFCEEFVSSQDIPPSPSLDDIATTLTSKLCVKQMFPGRELLKKTQDELFKMIQFNSPALNIGSKSTPRDGTRNKTPSSATFQPPSFRGSCSSETVRRSNRNSVDIMDCQKSTMDTNPKSNPHGSLPDHHSIDKPYINVSKHTNEKFQCSRKPLIVPQHTAVEVLEYSPSTESSFFNVESLTDAKALLDCNEKVSESKQSSQEYQLKRLSDINVPSTSYNNVDTYYQSAQDRRSSCLSDPLYRNMPRETNHLIPHYSNKKLHYTQNAMDLFEDHTSSFMPHKSDRRAGGDNAMGKDFYNESYTSKKPEDLNMFCDSYFKNSYKRDHDYYQSSCHSRTSELYHQAEHSRYGYGDWQIPSKDHIEIDMPEEEDNNMDILDFIDHERRLSHFALSHRDKYLIDKKGSKARLRRATPDSDGSPSWYASFKPEPITDSPEKMYPRRLY